MQNQRKARKEKDFVGSIPKTRRPDLLQAAATALLHEDFAARMVHGSSARLVAATKVLAKLLCARSMVPKRSACLTIARLPLLQGDCACTVVPVGGASLLDAVAQGTSIVSNMVARREINEKANLRGGLNHHHP